MNHRNKKRTGNWDDLPLKRCEMCDEIIPQDKEFRAKGRIVKMTPSKYRKTRFCSHECGNSYKTHLRIAKGFKPWLYMNDKELEMPDRESLNKLFNKHRNYEKMAKELGVSHQTIRRWLGPIKYMKNPRLMEIDDNKVFTEKDKRNVRRLYASGKFTQEELGVMYNSDAPRINRILRQRM